MAPRWHRVGRIIWSLGRRFYNFQGLRTFKGKFDPAWEPRYLAASGWFGPYLALIDIAVLIGGGMRAAFGRHHATDDNRRKRFIAAAALAIITSTALLPCRPAWALETGNLGHVHQFDPCRRNAGLWCCFPMLAAGLQYRMMLPQRSRAMAHWSWASICPTISHGWTPIRARRVTRGRRHRMISRQIQRERGSTSYRTPIVAGIGEGGAVLF